MDNKDEIKELFARKLQEHKIPVSSDIWNAVSSKIASSSTTIVLTSAVKIVSGIICATAIAIGIYVVVSPNKKETQKNSEIVNLPQKQKDNKQNEEKQTNNDDFISKKNINSINKQTTEIVEQDIYKEQSNYSTDLIKKIEIESERHVDTTTLIENTIQTKENIYKNIEQQNSDNKQTENENSASINVKENTPEEQSANTEIKTELSFEITRMPNVYSLHSSGYFAIEYRGEYADFQITILNDKNHIIFSSNDPNNVWRGIDSLGKVVATGNYFYILTVTDIKGGKINKYSSLRVIP